MTFQLKPNNLPPIKPEATPSAIKRKQTLMKNQTNYPSFSDIHPKFKANDPLFSENLRNKPNAGNNIHAFKIGGSDILKNLNFALNPTLSKKKPGTTNAPENSPVHKQMTSKTTAPTNSLMVTKNILEFRKKHVITISSISLQHKPKLKQSRSVCKGTISMLQNTEDTRSAFGKKTNDFVQATKIDVSEKAKDRIRMQMIGWLKNNKKEAINLINESKHIIMNWINYVGYIDKSEFDHLMNSIGIKNDRTLNDRLFWLFDLNGNGVIESSEIIIGIEMFKEQSLEEKVNMFFDLADEEGSGFLDAEKLLRFFCKNLKNEEEKNLVKGSINQFAEELNYRNPKNVSKDDILRATLTNPGVKEIVEKNVTVVKEAKKDLKFNSANLITNQFEHQSGIYFPYMEKLVKVIEEKEKLIEKFSDVKTQFVKVLKFSKNANNNESDSDDPLD